MADQKVNPSAGTIDNSAVVLPPAQGRAGLETQMAGDTTTISNLERPDGGIDGNGFLQPYIDQELFEFKTKTPLFDLFLKAKVIPVDSPEVEHAMVDKKKPTVTLKTAITDSAATTAGPFVMTLIDADKKLPQAFDTLICKGVHGYEADGSTVSKAFLTLFVLKRNADGTITVIAKNGSKTSADALETAPGEIPAGTVMIRLANACSETQKNVAPSSVVPKTREVYLQKRIMNNVVSDYFDKHKKKIPFAQAQMAEMSIINFKDEGNRNAWMQTKSKFLVETGSDMGEEYVYTSEGIRWMFVRELQHSGKWSYEQLIALMKMYYTGEDQPDSGIALCGKNVIENLQCIDMSSHPQAFIDYVTNETLGWVVAKVHTVFGDLEFKHDPTLDDMGYENSFAILSLDRLVRYVFATEHKFEEDVENREAKRSGIIVWDAPALKGSCHIFVDGEGDTTVTDDTITYRYWTSTTAPTTDDVQDGVVYYFLNDVAIAAISGKSAAFTAHAGDVYKYTTDNGWEEFNGVIAFN